MISTAAARPPISSEEPVGGSGPSTGAAAIVVASLSRAGIVSAGVTVSTGPGTSVLKKSGVVLKGPSGPSVVVVWSVVLGVVVAGASVVVVLVSDVVTVLLLFLMGPPVSRRTIGWDETKSHK